MTPILYHYSEEPDIRIFEPRVYASRSEDGPVVWALDAENAPMYLCPRDCPRVAYWSLPESTAEDIERFLGHTAARMVVAIESGWLDRMRTTTLYRYRMPTGEFEPDTAPGFYGAYLSRTTVRPLSVEPIPDLLAAHAAAGSELRITPSLWPLWDAVMQTTLHWSGVRLRNAAPRPEKQNL
ncbi:MAG: hypothetical protein SFU56_09385 [Capsulimonadales bacterium]|nr:hypothetical protein [Capsulimonadales bacterium]